MKLLQKIAVLFFLVSIAACSDNEPEKLPHYLKEKFSSSENCSSFDFIELNVNGQTDYYNYTGGGPRLCFHGEGNSGGLDYGQEGHFVAMRMPWEYENYMENFPLQVGEQVYHEFDDETYDIHDVYFTGFELRSVLPNDYSDHLVEGSYRVKDYLSDTGFDIVFRWEYIIIKEGNEVEYSYSLAMEKGKSYSVNITCVENEGDDVRVSGDFEGTFRPWWNGTPFPYFEFEASGSFSYLIIGAN